MKLFYQLAITFLLGTSTIIAQSEKDTIQAYRYYQKAFSFLTSSKTDSSIVYFKKALPIYKKAGAWERVAACYNGVSEGLKFKSKYKESVESAFRADKIFEDYSLSNPKERIKAYINICSANNSMSNYPIALEYCEKALKLSEKKISNDHSLISSSNYHLGILYRNLSKYETAIQYSSKALEINLRLYGESNPKVGAIHNDIASSYNGWGKPFIALKHYQKSLEIAIKNEEKLPEHLARQYFGLAQYHNRLKQYDETLHYYKKALGIFEKNENPFLSFATYINIGLVLTNLGEYNEAILFHKKGLNLGLSFLDKTNTNIAICYWNIGFVYDQIEQRELALEYYKKSLAIHLENFGNEHESIAELFGNIGNIFTSKKKYEEALKYHLKALNIHKSNNKDYSLNIAASLLSISTTYLEKNDLTKSLFYAKDALSMFENLYGKLSPLNVESYFITASIYTKKEDFNNAILFFDNAISSIQKTSSLNSKTVFNPENYGNHKMLFKILAEKAEMYQNKYKLTKDLVNLVKSIESYQKLNILISYTRKSFQTYDDKVFFSKKAKKIYSKYLKVQFSFIKETKDYANLDNSYSIVETSKSNTLKNLLSEIKAKGFEKISNSLLKFEKSLKTNQAYYKSKIIEEKDSIKIIEYENKLFDINKKQDSLTTVLEKNYPKYYQLKYQDEVISVQEVQQKLDANTTLLEFFTTDSITYAFTISKDTFAVKEISTPKLEEQVQTFRNSITKNVDEFKSKSYQMYQKVMAPIADQLVGDQVIIVPDGPLWHVNFDLLLTTPNESDNPRVWTYLLKDYAISYANSATLLFAKDQLKSQDKTELNECLAFSFSSDRNVTKTSNIKLSTLRNSNIDLPGTRKEIKAIANLVDGQYFYGSEATEKNFKKHVSNYNVLHLALHGTVDNEKPKNSKLYFTKTKDSTEDGFLYSHELFALDIPAELTVLSACNTGTGKLAKGEGIMSLGNAFQYAGTKSLLLTNWEVSDQTTPEIMKYFYTYLKKGKNKAQALQQAKLQYLASANEETNHPYYWGGFYLLGDTAPVQLSSANYLYWILGVTILGILLFGVFWHKKRSN